MKMWEANL